jgi:two-component system CheB/CheR fusion protein
MQESARLRVLAVDDQPDVVEMICLFVEKIGHVVARADNGKQALELAATFEPDVVLLDIGLPDINGYEIAKTLRSWPRGPELFLVAVTGWGREEDRQRAAAAGFDRHIVKPATSQAIREALLDAALRRSAGRQS